jgi:hypothetical protein
MRLAVMGYAASDTLEMQRWNMVMVQVDRKGCFNFIFTISFDATQQAYMTIINLLADIGSENACMVVYQYHTVIAIT